MTTLDITLDCPAMDILAAPGNPDRRLTAAEPMLLRIPARGLSWAVTIPQTIVDRQPTRTLLVSDWLVRACTGSGDDGQGNRLVTNLPPELTTFGRWTWYWTMVARQIMAPMTLYLADGSIWAGGVTFPDCPISILRTPMQAAACVVVGTLALAPARP